MNAALKFAIRALAAAEKIAARTEAAIWLAQGKPVIYGVHITSPLTVTGDDLLVSHCRLDTDAIPPAVYVPAEWTR